MKVKYLLIGVVVLFIAGVLTASSFAKIDLETIVGMWLFDEDEDDIAIDSSGNENHGTLTNGPEWIGGKFGKGLQFDGVSAYVDCGNVESLNITNAITIESWVYYTGTGEKWIGIVDQSQGASGNGGFGLHIGSGFHAFPNKKVVVHLGDGAAPSPNFITTNDIPTNQWVHVAAVWDGSTVTGSVKIYLDGVEQAGAETNYGTTLMAATKPTTIGAARTFLKPPPSCNYFEGIIDEVAIFNVPLSAQDIQTTMNKGLERASGLVAVDLSGKLTTTWAAIKAR